LAAPGVGRVTPEQQTPFMPLSAVVLPTYMVRESPGSMTISPTPLPANSGLPIGPVQVLPPSVDRYRPTPATHPEAQMFASPVPTHTVLPVRSLRSIVTVPAALIPRGPPRYSHFGVAARASLVRHTPPPAGVAYIRQLRGTHVSAMAIEVVRPPATYALGT
jgi:hypothetical protein